MKILLTGGAGFIGTHTAKALHAAGHEIRILDCMDPQIHGINAAFPNHLLAIAECVKGDICNAQDCERALEGIEAVFHFASKTGVGQSMYDIGSYVSTNLLGTAVLLETIVKARTPLKRFILSSSRAIYGEGLFLCVTHGVIHPAIRNSTALQAGNFRMYCPHCSLELTAIPTHTGCTADPLSVYAMTKKQQEDYSRYTEQTFGLPLVTLRYFNVYGSGQSLKNPYTGVVSIFYSLLKEGRALSLYEKGLPIRDFVHVADVVQANILALNENLPKNSIFNVGTGIPSTIADIATAQAKAMKVEARLEDHGEYRVGDVFGCYADIADSIATLGYLPNIDLHSGMTEFVSWAAEQESENLYDKTVLELKTHGLFGKAPSKTD